MLIDLSLPLEKNLTENTDQRESELFRLGHYGTHLDRLLHTSVPLDYFKSRGICFDIRFISLERPIMIEDIALDLVQPHDFVLLHTGALQRNSYATQEYLSENMELSWTLLEELLKRKIRFIGIDARGLRRNEEHRQVDTLCETAGVYVIENMAGTEQLPTASPFTIYTAPFDTGGTGLPVKVIAEIN